MVKEIQGHCIAEPGLGLGQAKPRLGLWSSAGKSEKETRTGLDSGQDQGSTEADRTRGDNSDA